MGGALGQVAGRAGGSAAGTPVAGWPELANVPPMRKLLVAAGRY